MQDATFCFERCRAVPTIKTDASYCKTKIVYHIDKEPKERSVTLNHVYTFPIIEKCVKSSYGFAISILKDLYNNDLTAKNNYYDVRMNTSHFELSNDEYAEDPDKKVNITMNTKQLSCVRRVGGINQAARPVIAIRTRPSPPGCGMIHFFEIVAPCTNAEYLCQKINKLIEIASDNFILERHSIDEFTIDIQILQNHVDILNHVIKEMIDMAIVVARSIEAKKKLERNNKGNNNKKNRSASLKLIAKAPTSQEFVELIQKFRLSLNYMARLNPFVNNPNIPELLHHIIVPFSLISAVCGLEIVKNVKRPYLTSKTIWLIENCLTTKEISFWRTLGDNWNQPKSKFSSCELYDDYCDFNFNFENKKKLSISPSASMCDLTKIEISDLSSSKAIVVSPHYPDTNDQLRLYLGENVTILESRGEFYHIRTVSGITGTVPKAKIYVVPNIFSQDCELFYSSARYIDDIATDAICPATTRSDNEKTESCTNTIDSHDQISENQASENLQTPEEFSEHSEHQDINEQQIIHEKKPSYTYSQMKLKSDSDKISLNENTQSVPQEQTENTKQSENAMGQQYIMDEVDTDVKQGAFKGASNTDSTPVSSSQKTKSKSEEKKKKICWCCTRKPKVCKDLVKTSDQTVQTSESKSTKKSEKSTTSGPAKSCSAAVELSHSPSAKTTPSTQTQSCMDGQQYIEEPIEEIKEIMDPQYECVIDNQEVEECQNICVDDRIASNDGISLSWKKSQNPPEECIKIGGINLFRVRIKLVPNEETLTHDSENCGKATIVLKKPHGDHILAQNQQSTTGEKSKMFISRKTVETSDKGTSGSLTKGRKLSRRDSSRLSGSRSKKTCQMFATGVLASNVTKQQVKHTRDESSSSELTKSHSRKRRECYDQVKMDETCVKSTRNCQKDKTTDDKLSAVSSEEVYRIIKKYIPDATKPSLQNIPDTKTSASYEKSGYNYSEVVICKECGGVCKNKESNVLEKPAETKTVGPIEHSKNGKNTVDSTTNIEIPSLEGMITMSKIHGCTLKVCDKQSEYTKDLSLCGDISFEIKEEIKKLTEEDEDESIAPKVVENTENIAQPVESSVVIEADRSATAPTTEAPISTDMDKLEMAPVPVENVSSSDAVPASTVTEPTSTSVSEPTVVPPAPIVAAEASVSENVASNKVAEPELKSSEGVIVNQPIENGSTVSNKSDLETSTTVTVTETGPTNVEPLASSTLSIPSIETTVITVETPSTPPTHTTVDTIPTGTTESEVNTSGNLSITASETNLAESREDISTDSSVVDPATSTNI